MANALDLPLQCRGTIRIGATDYHYARSVRSGDLMLVKGPDPRDWAAIDAGALDYSIVAQQEHDVPGFVSHDGPRISQACPICNGLAYQPPKATGEAAVALPTNPPPEAVQAEAAVVTEAVQAAGVTGAADPKDNAGIPPTDPDVVAGARPAVRRASARVTNAPSPVTRPSDA